MFSYNVLDGSSNSLLKCATALALTVVAFALRFQRKRTNIAFVPIPVSMQLCRRAFGKLTPSVQGRLVVDMGPRKDYI